jgi:hypothetical protein
MFIKSLPTYIVFDFQVDITQGAGLLAVKLSISQELAEGKVNTQRHILWHNTFTYAVKGVQGILRELFMQSASIVLAV